MPTYHPPCAETATGCYNRWLVELVELRDKIIRSPREREINSARIVVVGEEPRQVVPARSGIDLPRGEDIKTRVPLVMQLRNIAHGSPEHALISGLETLRRRSSSQR